MSTELIQEELPDTHCFPRGIAGAVPLASAIGALVVLTVNGLEPPGQFSIDRRICMSWVSWGAPRFGVRLDRAGREGGRKGGRERLRESERD